MHLSTKEFIASLVGSLAWPAAVVVLVLLLREQIRSMLGRQVRRLKAGPVELEWDRTLAETRKEVELPPGIVGEGSSANVVGDLFQVVEVSPAAAVFEGYKRVQEALERRIGGVYEGELPSTDARDLARLARDLDIVTDETVRAVDGLAVLRDLAAHAPPGRITREEAEEYLSLVQAVLYTVSTWIKPDRPEDD